MALVPPLDYTPEEVRSLLKPLRNRVSVAVYSAQNAFAVGAIIRVAHSFLVREILLIGATPFYEKASMGMQRFEDVVVLPDETAFFEHARGRPLWAIEKDHATTSLYDVPGYPDDVVLMPGSPARSLQFSIGRTPYSASRCMASTIRCPSRSLRASSCPTGRGAATRPGRPSPALCAAIAAKNLSH